MYKSLDETQSTRSQVIDLWYIYGQKSEYDLAKSDYVFCMSNYSYKAFDTDDLHNRYHAVWDRLSGFDEMPEGKTVIFGHTPTIRYQEANPMRIWHGDRRIGIDCGCSYPTQGQLSCLRLDDMKEFYSEV